MSLAYNASPWISDTTEQQTQKRIPTMRKTIKKMQIPKPEFMAKPNPDIGSGPGKYAPNITSSPSSYMSQEEVYRTNSDIGPERPMISHSMDNSELGNHNTYNDTISIHMQDQEKRQDRVNEILKNMNNQIHIENDGGNLANFKPLDSNTLHAPTMRAAANAVTIPQSQIPSESLNLFHGLKPQDSNRPAFAAMNLGENNFDKTATYNRAYEVPPTVASWSRGSRENPNGNLAIPMGSEQQRLLDKINYMIHLLEQQQNEKTNNSLEEFVMFSLVGIFIIYVLDNFSRTARYTR